MKTSALLILLGVAMPAHAGEGRVVFICDQANAATCELAATQFEARSRTEGWGLAGRAATVEGLDADQLALARIVVTIDTVLYRQWYRSIARLETWDGVPPAAGDRAAAEADLRARIAALGATFAR